MGGAGTSHGHHRVVPVGAGGQDVGDLEEAAEAAIAIGASRVGEVVYDEMGGFQVMADPEGNEFCLINGPTAITA